MLSFKYLFLLAIAVLVLLPAPAAAFGAGNIASISKIEGHNWRHGDIEDMLKTVACLKGHKWTSMMIKRVYFGNWLRDYSQAVDVGTLKGVQADTIRILVWILAFMSFGYATGEFEVTSERLGVYRPEEHIDNPRDYADNQDARQYDARLRPPVMSEELQVDPNTGMKNYIANEHGNWATSAGYIKYSFARAIHFGRVYTSGSNRGREEDLCEALRCLGQGLHCVEDFGAHSNYVELALRELGFTNVFPHTGSATEINLHGKRVFPLVTGTFGGVDFLHSVLGEATDHVTQSEVDEMNTALADAVTGKKDARGSGSELNGLTDLLSKVPGTSGLAQEARNLQDASNAQAAINARGFDDGYSASRASNGGAPTFAAPPGSVGGPPGPGIPGMNPNLDPATIVPKIYPILEFRDKVVRTISGIISKIPGLESLIDKISERVTLFVMSLLAPFVQPIITAASKQLKEGSSAVINASGRHQYEPWTDPHCTDPTHSLLSKDHFSNILNEPAGQVATASLQYVAPRIIYAMEHPDVSVDEVLNDIVRIFHHPAIRDHNCELHHNMFAVVERWVHSQPDRGSNLNNVLSSESVRNGHNHKAGQGGHGHGPGGGHGSANTFSGSQLGQMLNSNRDVEPPSSSTFPGAAYHASEAYQQSHQSQSPAFQHSPYQAPPPGPSYGDPYHQGYQDTGYPQHPPPPGPPGPPPPGPPPPGQGYGGGYGGYGGYQDPNAPPPYGGPQYPPPGPPPPPGGYYGGYSGY